MEILKKFFLIIFFAVVLLFVGLSVYIHKNGKALVEDRLSAVLHKEVHVGKARLLFPLGLRFDNVEIKDAMTAKVLRVNLGIPVFLGGHFNIAKVKLKDPVFFITYSNDKKVFWGTPDNTVTVPVNVPIPAVIPDAARTSKNEKSSQGIMIDYLEVTDGNVKVFDQPHKSVIDVAQINLKAMEFALPARNMKTKFDFSAVVSGDNAPFAGQKAEARGMVNFVALNMDASVKVIDPNGNSSFSAHFKSLNNDMIVKGTINVGKFVSGIRTKGSKESSFEGFLATALESSGVEIGVNFMCETKMNDFNCDKIGMSGNVVQNAPAVP